ncbi:MAG TPA: hypothetical protein VE134_00850 [Methanomicrobiales archaeon]|nr:hypothetical protein [Methanomicrobiales archaeon]
MEGATFLYLAERAAKYQPIRRRSQMSKIIYSSSRESAQKRRIAYPSVVPLICQA